MSGGWVYGQNVFKDNLSSKILRVIQKMYSQNKSNFIFLNGEQFEYFQCHPGLRQGENMSRILFSPYLNKLENFITTNGSHCLNI